MEAQTSRKIENRFFRAAILQFAGDLTARAGRGRACRHGFSAFRRQGGQVPGITSRKTFKSAGPAVAFDRTGTLC